MGLFRMFVKKKFGTLTSPFSLLNINVKISLYKEAYSDHGSNFIEINKRS